MAKLNLDIDKDLHIEKGRATMTIRVGDAYLELNHYEIKEVHQATADWCDQDCDCYKAGQDNPTGE